MRGSGEREDGRGEKGQNANKRGIRVSNLKAHQGCKANKCSGFSSKNWQSSLEKTLCYAIIGLVADGGKKFQTKRDGRR